MVHTCELLHFQVFDLDRLLHRLEKMWDTSIHIWTLFIIKLLHIIYNFTYKKIKIQLKNKIAYLFIINIEAIIGKNANLY